jgi:hypothetical protein
MVHLVQVSHLRCKKCGVEFDYKWVPTASFTTIRLGNRRLMRCPSCKKWSVFNVRDTRIDENGHECALTVGPG